MIYRFWMHLFSTLRTLNQIGAERRIPKSNGFNLSANHSKHCLERMAETKMPMPQECRIPARIRSLLHCRRRKAARRFPRGAKIRLSIAALSGAGSSSLGPDRAASTGHPCICDRPRPDIAPSRRCPARRPEPFSGSPRRGP